jgi:hypothetical protein
MRVIGPVLAGALALTVPIVAHAVPLGEKIAPTSTGINAGIIQVWGGCGWGWHPVPGHWSRWRGWVPPHCAPNDAGGWRGAYGGPGYPNWGWGGYGGGWQGPPRGGGYYSGGWGNP